ncbi:MAG: glycosyltransferase [Candidatus Aenigmarchaeota archaeon]|nr:glycosyltransferase [Candidatus Aenigmarchaeota archaeon]
MKKNVDILVFSYNNENVIGACLDSISRQTYKNFTCTLVDDCSTDNTVSIARKKYPCKIEQIMYACSAAWIMRRSVIEKIGLFDDTYFYPHEDTDFCWRANLAGFHVIYNPDAVAYHRVGDSTKKMSDKVAFHVTKNRIRSMLKNYESKNIIKYLPLHLFLIGANIVVAGKGISKIKGLLWNIKNIEDTLNERNAVRKTRKRSDKELKSLFAGKII